MKRVGNILSNKQNRENSYHFEAVCMRENCLGIFIKEFIVDKSTKNKKKQ